MKVLAINAGSSSLKYKVFEMPQEKALIEGSCEGIGETKGYMNYSDANEHILRDACVFKSQEDAFEQMVRSLTGLGIDLIGGLGGVSAVGHRIVHGGCLFEEPVCVTEATIEQIEKLAEVALLHNKVGAAGIRACRALLGDKIPEIAVFDTCFHSTMPRHAYMFGIPYEYYEKYGVRRFGFHGLSHAYVSRRYSELVKKDLLELKIVSCHLGSGCSIAAICEGISIDTSMGFTPVDGLLMGTRSGSIDPSAVLYLMKNGRITVEEMDEILNKKSGYLGLSGVSSDIRVVYEAALNGNQRAQLAINVQAYQIKKQIGAYIAAMNGVDAVIFTGGIGCDSAMLRLKVCKDMTVFGLELDELENQVRSRTDRKLSQPSSKDIWVIETNEELELARIVEKILN